MLVRAEGWSAPSRCPARLPMLVSVSGCSALSTFVLSSSACRCITSASSYFPWLSSTSARRKFPGAVLLGKRGSFVPAGLTVPPPGGDVTDVPSSSSSPLLPSSSSVLDVVQYRGSSTHLLWRRSK